MAIGRSFHMYRCKLEIFKLVFLTVATVLLSLLVNYLTKSDYIELHHKKRYGHIGVPSFSEVVAKSNLHEKLGRRKNVIFLITDDMRTQIGPYYKDSAFTKPKPFTPHLDRLASKSLLLKQAYIQFSLCGPSRTSMLTSRRPDTSQVYYNDNNWRKEGGNFTTLPQYFKENGYTSLCYGKVFHAASVVQGDYPLSWSQPCVIPQSTEDWFSNGTRGAIWKDIPDNSIDDVPLDDILVVRKMKRHLKELAPDALSGKTPFFLAMGFKKPHLPYICPQKFFKKYTLETSKQFLSDLSWQTPSVRVGCNVVNTTKVDEFSSVLADRTLRYYRKAYFACISYVDSLVGEILDTVETLGLSDSTIISFVADHGYHLGENGIFGKQSVLDASTHVPMMISIPGQTNGGVSSEAIVEAVDLFPTIVEAAGLKKVPRCPRVSFHVKLCTHGVSFLPLVKAPKNHTKTIAMSQIRPDTPIMQYSVRTTRYRFSQWARCRDENAKRQPYELVAESVEFPTELYDHRDDREETVNLAMHKEYYTVKLSLQRQLRSLWKTFH